LLKTKEYQTLEELKQKESLPKRIVK